MKFRTEIGVRPFPFHIDHKEHILALGSCFAGSITEHLKELGFHITSNPTGVVFNPESIAQTVEMLSERKAITPIDLHHSNGLYFNYSFHSSFSDTDADCAMQKMRLATEQGADSLDRSSVVIVTFGTAWVYERNGEVVANCHKQPASEFVRRPLSIEQIVQRWCKLLQNELSGKRVIFTLSPIRHLRDDARENSLSKALLRVAIDSITKSCNNAHYFEAYELMMDDLRDYRFYDEDMTHPSKVAVEYICEKFDQAIMSPQTIALAKEVRSISSALKHTPLHATSPQYETFRERTLERAKELKESYGIEFSLLK